MLLRRCFSPGGGLKPSRGNHFLFYCFRRRRRAKKNLTAKLRFVSLYVMYSAFILQPILPELRRFITRDAGKESPFKKCPFLEGGF